MNRAAVMAQFERLRSEALRTDPVTDEDRREYRILDARQRARDDARRNRSPQLALQEAA